MIKFKVKRRLSGKAIRKAKREWKRYDLRIISDHENKLIEVKVPKKRPNRFSYDFNKPTGRKYPLAIYELEGSKRWDDIQRRHIAKHDWKAFSLIKNLQKNKKKNAGKLKRLYKLYPEYSPVFEREKIHQEKVKKWQEKLYKNHVVQCQSLK